MAEPPRVMSTQHPDNATVPFLADGSVIEGDDEIQEAYYVYSHLGCDEQMWDFEGKEGDEYAVQKLLSRHDDFFLDNRLGDDLRLTLRGPNPDVQATEAKVLLEILESVPRSFDIAAAFADEHDVPRQAPIFEVIVPMVTSAVQLDMVHEYYRRFVVGKGEEHIWETKTVADWVGDFEPAEISVIPLIEDRVHTLAAHDIVREYLRGRDVDDQRVFLARSDPAMNYGSLSADLVNLIALQRLHDLEEEIDVSIHPILGAGSAPFRGGLSPDSAAAVVDAYPSVETYTVQSAFKYDYPVRDVQDAVETLRTRERGPPQRIDEDRALSVVDRVAEVYTAQVDRVADTVNRVADLVPDRRARKLHVGLFGYSREVGDNALPRAITFTASLYSVGFPPEFMGVAGLTDDDLDFVAENFPRFFDLLETAAGYYNPRSLSYLDVDEDRATAALDLVDHDPDPDHRAATDAVIDGLEENRPGPARSAVREAAGIRGFLG